jgi:hypothetical protein
MPQALITLDENSNRILNVVKAKYDLKDKSMAVEWLIDFYLDQQDDPELRPEFIRKMQRIEKEEKSIRYANVEELRRDIEQSVRRRKASTPKKT